MKKTLKTNTTKFIYIIFVISLTLGLSISLQSLLADWTVPTNIPPQGNALKPVNIGTSTEDIQTVLGGLAASNLAAIGNLGANKVITPELCLGSGNDACKTTWPEGVGSSVPAGTISAFYLSTCPTGWVLANGANSTPDLRGNFIRGLATSRTLGSYEADASPVGVSGSATVVGPHEHMYNGGGEPGYYWTYNGPSSFSIANAYSTGLETRPKNVALIYCMKTDTETPQVSLWSKNGSNVYYNEGNVGIGLTDPGVKFEIAQNNAIKLGNTYISSGGNYAHLATNEWFNGTAWQTNGMAGGLIQINGNNNQMYYYVHDAAGNNNYGNINAADFCIPGGKCLSTLSGSAPDYATYNGTCTWVYCPKCYGACYCNTAGADYYQMGTWTSWDASNCLGVYVHAIYCCKAYK